MTRRLVKVWGSRTASFKSYYMSKLWNMPNEQIFVIRNNKRTRSGLLSFVVKQVFDIIWKGLQQIWMDIWWFSLNKYITYKRIVNIHRDYNLSETEINCGLNSLILPFNNMFMFYVFVQCLCKSLVSNLKMRKFFLKNARNWQYKMNSTVL